MAKNNLIAKGMVLFIEALIAGGFIETIREIVKETIPLMKLVWMIIYLLFVVADVVVYIKYGEEIILFILEWLGIDLNEEE